jgi:hypothetical protein
MKFNGMKLSLVLFCSISQLIIFAFDDFESLHKNFRLVWTFQIWEILDLAMAKVEKVNIAVTF